MNQKDKFISEFEELFNAAKFERIISRDIPYEYYANPISNPITFLGEDAIRKYRKVFTEINEISKYIFTKEQVRIFIFKLVSDFKGKKLTDDVWVALTNMINKNKKVYTVYAPIIGGILDEDELTIGPYIVKRNQLDVENKPQEKFISMLSHIVGEVSQQTEYSILFKVEAASKEKAIELAIPYFELFELITKFLLKDKEYAQIGIINFSNYTLQQFSVICDTDNDASFSLKPQNATFPINFSQLINNDKGKFIWDLINEKFLGKINEMQSRILHAIEWIGRAEYEHQIANKYVEYVFAIETLLTFKPKGTIITPSIANQLSEYATFIISESTEEIASKKEFRMAIMKIFKNIYQNRSKIVHGSNKDISENDIKEAIEAITLLVNSFIQNKELSNFSKIEELASWVENLKFS